MTFIYLETQFLGCHHMYSSKALSVTYEKKKKGVGREPELSVKCGGMSSDERQERYTQSPLFIAARGIYSCHVHSHLQECSISIIKCEGTC